MRIIAEPEPASAVPPIRTRWWRRRRTIVIAASVMVVLLVATAAGIAVQLDIDAAHRQYLAADESAGHAEERLRELTADLADATAESTDTHHAIEAVLVIEGDGLDAAARERLALALQQAALLEPQTPTIPPALETPTSGTAAQWRELTAAQQERIASLEELHLAFSADTERVRGTTETLTAALADYLDAAASVGSAILADRADAAADTTSALQAAIDALTQASPADAATRLTAHVTAAAAVIASSEEARRPRAPVGGAGGSGYRIPDPASITAVVNKTRSLAAAYAPSDLRRPAGVGNALPLRAEAAAAAERMAADMAAAGITLRMSSGYRSYARQSTIYTGFVSREGVAAADTHSARPGHSEHQTGLAADFDDGTGCNLQVCFRDRPGGIWLAENAWRYGWILRYGDGWQPIVGYRFEPWHYRYVGVEVAAAMHASGVVTLEEHFGTGAAPDYVG